MDIRCWRMVSPQKGNNMAIVNLKNATVQRVFFDGKGVALYESFESRGEQRKSYYTAWFAAAPDVKEGDVLNVSGLLQVKEREYEKDGQTKRSIDVSLNSARIETGTESGTSAPAPVEEPWASTPPGGYSNETPF